MGSEGLFSDPSGVALALALLLGLRHATEPDHLTAVITLVASSERQGSRTAARLGLAWGAGHGVTCLLFGAAAVALGPWLPESLRASAEIAIGALIVLLAARLLWRWGRGQLHSHPHRHGDVEHNHPHLHAPSARHAPSPRPHTHAHAEKLGRSPRASFGIGLLHGVGGSAIGTALVVAPLAEPLHALALLLLFVSATTLVMAGATAGLGAALARGPLAQRLEAALPALAVGSLLFGVWYTLHALELARAL